jgi:hypothetical protein
MKSLSRLFCAAVLGAASLCSHAALVSTHYTHDSGDRWSVDLTVTNDNAMPAQISWFTVYFSEALFSDLSLVAAPATWDPLVIQPDTGIPASGFLDALVFDAADALALGQSQSGFTLSFNYLGADAPGALFYEILDDSMNVLADGQSVVTTGPQAVPEPGSLALAGLAWGAMCVVRRSRRRIVRATAAGAA